MSVINYPDSAGLACNAVASGLSSLPYYNGFSVPYYPNFYLGAEQGSGCDSLTGINNHTGTIANLSVYPNPGAGVFRISYQLPPNRAGILEIYNTLGELIFKENLSAWSMVHEVDITGKPAGIYLCRVSSGVKSGIIKFVKQ